MTTYKVTAKYGASESLFRQNIISATPELAEIAAMGFIRTKIRGANQFTKVQIVEVREVKS